VLERIRLNPREGEMPVPNERQRETGHLHS